VAPRCSTPIAPRCSTPIAPHRIFELPRCSTPIAPPGVGDSCRCSTPVGPPRPSSAADCTSQARFSVGPPRPSSAADCTSQARPSSAAGRPSVKLSYLGTQDTPRAGVPSRWPVRTPFGPEVTPRMASSRHPLQEHVPTPSPTPWAGGASESMATPPPIATPLATECAEREEPKQNVQEESPPGGSASADHAIHDGQGRIARAVRNNRDRETSRSPWPVSTWRPISQMIIPDDHLPGAPPGRRAAGLSSRWPKAIGGAGNLRQYTQAPPIPPTNHEPMPPDCAEQEQTELPAPASPVENAPRDSSCAAPDPPPRPPSAAASPEPTPKTSCFPAERAVLMEALDDLRNQRMCPPRDWKPSIGVRGVKQILTGSSNARPRRPVTSRRPVSSNGISVPGSPMWHALKESGRATPEYFRGRLDRERARVEILYAPRGTQTRSAHGPCEAW
jgi:hypothetical protein